jgi:hypothetical protein
MCLICALALSDSAFVALQIALVDSGDRGDALIARRLASLDDLHETDVHAVLLAVGMLNKAQRQEFAEQFNKFVYGSTQTQRRMMQQWGGKCRDSKNPTTRMIAESSAIYVATPKTTRRKKKPDK